jgi:hypothetical protein
VKTPNFSVIVHKNQLNLMGLVHGMQRNGPLPQVRDCNAEINGMAGKK